jgi:hypothetical protein
MNSDYDDWYEEAIEQNKLSLSCIGAASIVLVSFVVISIAYYLFTLI